MDNTTIIGIAASTFTGMFLLPQVLKLVKEKKSSDISMRMLGTLFAGLILWCWYGIRLNDWVIICANAVSLILNAWIVLLNMRYKEKE